MSDVKVITGVLENGNRYAQWWATVKLHGLMTEECVASIWERDGRFGVTVQPEAPDNTLNSIRYVLSNLEQGQLVKGTHSVTWQFGKPTFTAVAA